MEDTAFTAWVFLFLCTGSFGKSTSNKVLRRLEYNHQVFLITCNKKTLWVIVFPKNIPGILKFTSLRVTGRQYKFRSYVSLKQGCVEIGNVRCLLTTKTGTRFKCTKPCMQICYLSKYQKI